MTGGADWPLVGRAAEITLLRELRSAARPKSAVITGPRGIGKSQLARFALDEAASEGWNTLIIKGNNSLSAVPFGAFRTVLRMPTPAVLDDLTDSVSGVLKALRSEKGLIVWGDDFQDLDDASAALLTQLVASGQLVALLTTGLQSPQPASLSALWMDGSAERIELAGLSRIGVVELMTAVLSGSVQDSTADRIWRITDGNPLYLREVILSSQESGALRQVDHEWSWRGEWAKGARLQEVVATRLGRLDADELTVMELLAVARSLPFDVVASLSTVRAVVALEERSLVTTERSGRRLEIAIASPLVAEVLRSAMKPLQQLSIRRNLVRAVTATGARRTADRVRLACWSLESGVEVDLVTLAQGADASLFAIGPAIAARLQEILPGLADNLPASEPPVGEDIELAVRLAQAAYDRTGQVLEGVALASTLAWTGETARAENVLSELSERAKGADERLQLALALAFVRFWGRYDVKGAESCLIDELDLPGVGCDPELVAKVFELLAGIALQTARPARALEYAQRAADVQNLELSLSLGIRPAPAALTHLGRCGQALALIDEALGVARHSEHPLTMATLLFTKAGALARMGELEQARQLAEWLRDVSIEGGFLDATASYGIVLGGVLLREGRCASAGRIFQDAAGLLTERDVLGYRPWALAGLALARAQAGEEEAAAVALDDVRRTQPIARHYDMTRFLAEIELHKLMGRSGAAVEVARQAAEWARGAGMPEDEAQALDAWIRIAPSPPLAQRLAEVAVLTDSVLVGLFAEHAHALISRNPEQMLDVSRRFAVLPAWRLAAETATRASEMYEKQGQPKAGQIAARAAADYAGHCEGGFRLLVAAPELARLSKRELEIAHLAAEGRPSKEIADRMYLSRRTVDSHLYHVYTKLGVSDRAGLADLLKRFASRPDAPAAPLGD